MSGPLGFLPDLFKQEARAIDGSDIEGIEVWATAVDEAYSPRLDIAVTRLVRAVAERADPGDALIDAVIAWESLVGGPTETTFKVTVSMAHLLEREPAERLGQQKALAAIYDGRSALVHGRTPDNPDQVPSWRDQAVDAGIDALKALLTTHTDLLSLASTSKRATRLALGMSPPTATDD